MAHYYHPPIYTYPYPIYYTPVTTTIPIYYAAVPVPVPVPVPLAVPNAVAPAANRGFNPLHGQDPGTPPPGVGHSRVQSSWYPVGTFPVPIPCLKLQGGEKREGASADAAGSTVSGRAGKGKKEKEDGEHGKSEDKGKGKSTNNSEDDKEKSGDKNGDADPPTEGHTASGPPASILKHFAAQGSASG